MTGLSVSGIVPRFDWYAATVNASVENLRHVLSRDLAASVAPEDGPRHGFHFREVARDLEGRTVATLLHGGNGDIPHTFASSDTAHKFAEIIRREWPDRHRVSRVDAALDFDGPGTWDKLLSLCEGIASGERVEGDLRRRASKVRTNQMGDWFHGEHGRTFYLGSFKSAVLVRLYEKGIQLREDAARRGVTRDDDFTDDAVRLEVQVRPDGDSKRLAATATPLEVFGYADWSRELLRRLRGVNDIQRVHIKERRDSDTERAMQWMAHQYAGPILEEVQRLGGWEALGRDLRRRIETQTTGDAFIDPDDMETPF